MESGQPTSNSQTTKVNNLPPATTTLGFVIDATVKSRPAPIAVQHTATFQTQDEVKFVFL